MKKNILLLTSRWNSFSVAGSLVTRLAVWFRVELVVEERKGRQLIVVM